MDEGQHALADPVNEAEGSVEIPSNTYLVFESIKVFPLEKDLVSIGRRLESALVIDDPRVSRTHAQLRAINGRYVIFDMNSTGGTYVNGQKVSQSVLYPGDVISLAGVQLFFRQDSLLSRPDLKETSPLGSSDGISKGMPGS